MNNLDVCPKCGSKRIITNKEINNAWVMCAKCGYYLRKPRKVGNNYARFKN